MLTPVDVFVKGPGSGREAAIRAYRVPDWAISSIKTSAYPHNGCVLPREEGYKDIEYADI